MIKVAFLFDKLNDWIARYLPEKLLNTNGFCFNEIYDERNVRGFDIVFVIGYTKILKGEILKSNKLLLVVHESDLPNGKGFAPIQWQILKGVNEITVCLLELVDKIDSGNIYEKYNLSLDGTELYDEIRFKQANATFELIANFLSKYPNCYSSPQVGKSSSYRKRTPKDSQLHLDRSIREQFQLLRICNNKEWPAFFELNGITYTLKIDKKK